MMPTSIPVNRNRFSAFLLRIAVVQIVCFLNGNVLLSGQTDSLPPAATIQADTADRRMEQIAAARQALRANFVLQDTAATGFWLDSLGRLGNDAYAATLWDERWLLYHWLGRYPQLLKEVASYTSRTIPEGWLANPPEDSLFQLLDEMLYKDRLDLFERISRSDLSKEDKLFSILHLEFLLRIGFEGEARLEQDQKLENFVSQFPNSRYRPYLGKYMYDGRKPGAFALGLDMAFAYGNWTDDLERTLTPYYGMQIGLSYWKKHWNAQFRGAFGWQKLDRPVFVRNSEWPKDDPVISMDFSVELGRDIIDKERIRIFPTAGIGAHFLNPPSPGEGEDPYPAYYDDFYFQSLSLTAALTTDLKFPYRNEAGDWKSTREGYHGVRLRVGFTKLNFGRKNEALAGNLIFFAVGYNLFGPQSGRRTL